MAREGFVMDARMSHMFALGMLAMATVMVAGTVLADDEPNDDYHQSEIIEPGVHTGNLTRRSDEADHYVLSIEAGQIIQLTFRSRGGQDFLYARLENWNKETLMELSSKGNLPEKGPWYTSNDTRDTNFYLIITCDTVGGDYDLNLEILDQNDGDTGHDLSGTVAGALGICSPAQVAGEVADDDTGDMYRFWAGSGDIIQVDFTSQSQEEFMYLNLLDREDWTTLSLRSKGDQTASDTWYTALETEASWWYLEVVYDTEGAGYQLSLSLEHQNDSASGMDAPGELASAMLLENGTWTGHVEDDDTTDCYKFRMGGGDIARMVFSASAMDDLLYLDLLDRDDWTLLTLEAKQGTAVEDEHWTTGEDAHGWYYLVVNMDTSPGPYSLSLTIGRQDDAGSLSDVQGSCPKAFELDEGQYTGWLGGEDVADAYKVAVREGDALEVTILNHGEVPVMADLLETCGASPLGTISSKDGVPAEWTGNVTPEMAKEGYAFIRVYPEAKWKNGSYDLGVDTIPAPPRDTERPIITLDGPPTEAPEGEDARINVTVSDNGGVREVVLYYRTEGMSDFTTTRMMGDGNLFTASIPREDFEGNVTIEWYITAEDDSGNVQYYGTELQPKTMQVTKPPEDEDGSPGFGLLLALVATLAAGMAAAGRRG